MSQKFYTALLFLAFLATGAMAQNPTKTITDDDLQGGTSYTWSSDTTYLLDGFVFLETGGILTIEAGTVIKGLQSPSNDDLASTLIITRGAQIFAEGTRNNPIIFTAEIDDTEDPGDMFVDDRGLWGGLIVLGNATITDEVDEVIVEGLPADDDRSLYGGSDDTDNSGVLKYISIRHGGAELAPGEEINGLTMGGIGSGTSVSFVEVLANLDDGIEFFGGTVDLKYATVAFCGDDAIDWDTGWRGRGQFWSVLQGADAADNGAEMDGAKPDANTPSSNPQVYNVTYVGAGQGAAAANEHALYFRDGTRGGYFNSIFTDYANFAIQVEDRASGVDSRQYMEQGELVIANNLWFGFGEGDELNAGDNGFIQATPDAEDPTAQFLIDHLAANSNAIVDPQLGGISRDADGGFDPRPAVDGPAYTTTPAAYPTDDFYTKVGFKGAYCAEGSWLTGWTALAEYGVLADGVDYTDFSDEFACDLLQASVTRTIQDDDLQGGQSYTWSSDTIYLLDGFVFLESGGTLTIEPGTVIKGLQSPSNDDLASTLIITRGAQIFAEGTRNNPIIFTAEIDDTEDPGDMFVDDRGLWGGLIVLGNATITDEVDEVIVEGLPADDDRSLYGGSDDTDNSGVLKYISIRHGGAELAPGEEINGLTMGGIGSGTSVSFVEVLANLDDGIEFFGGTVDLKYASVAFCGDDAIDWDTGWRGRGQFWSVLQGADAADNGAEMDGAKPDANTPSSNPQVYNVTYIGAGQGAAAANEHALYFRDGTRGGYYNSIFTDYANFAIQVEDRASGVDSRQYMEQGELVIANNLWFGFGEGGELNAGDEGIIQATPDAEDPTAQFLIDHLAANGNQIVDPQLGGISRDADGGFDPRPAMDGPAYNTPVTGYAESDFFTPVAFKGAYCANGSWLTGWTALAEYGVQAGGVDYTDFTSDFGCDLSTDVETIVKAENGVKLFQNTPNPVVDVTFITFELPTTATVNLEVYDINGRMISRLIDGEERIVGQHTVEFNAVNLEDGFYVYRLTAGNVQITKPFVVNR
jgi:trimeric autotransporter adhesin